LKSDLITVSQKWSPYCDDVLHTTFGSLPWRSRSQHDLAAKLRPDCNCHIISRILQQFHRNDHHIGMTCFAQHFGRYLEGQGHNMTLQQKRVRPITFLAHLSTKCSWWAIVTGLCPSCVVVRCPSCVVRRASCVVRKLFYLNIFFSETIHWILTKLHRNDPWVVPYQRCSNGSDWLHK